MNVERATGLVLRTRPLTETSLIVLWLTREAGRLATVAKGARRPKSPFRGQIDLFYLADLSFARSRRSDLHTLREVRLLESHSALRAELAWLQQASYCAALIEQTTEAEAPMPEAFDQFAAFLRQLPKQPAQPHTIFAFEIKWLNELGLMPKLEESRLTLGARQILQRWLEMDWPDIFRLRLSGAQTAEIRGFLHGFLVYHLDRIPRGRSAAA
ncbi:MAG: DNA repair protein RecO [Verrucomicrobiota bacterium]|jgi:DNA repair protein RecO (recombination protein O)